MVTYGSYLSKKESIPVCGKCGDLLHSGFLGGRPGHLSRPFLTGT